MTSNKIEQTYNKVERFIEVDGFWIEERTHLDKHNNLIIEWVYSDGTIEFKGFIPQGEL